MDELIFNDDWMEHEPLHTHVIAATSEMIGEFACGNEMHIENMGHFLYHFTSCWYQRILDSGGMLVEPAVKSCSLFTAHMTQVHDMPVEQQFGCVAMLTRFCALVITKAGGRLL